jgi:4-hydroxybenzoate polyprenyltransferase
MNLRNQHIALAVGVVVLFGGAFLFRHSGEGALQVVALVFLIVTFGTAQVLDARDYKRRKARGQ